MADGIAKFWRWWKTARPRIEKAIAAESLDAVADEITKHVRALDRGLGWEIGGRDRTYSFALIWNGELARRRIGERWTAAAPKQKSWRFEPARPPSDDWADLAMEIGKHRVALDGYVCAFDVDGDRDRVDVTLFHPALAKAPEEVRGQVGFVLLDRLFGEDGVERWVGTVELATRKPKGARPVKALLAAVAKLAKAKHRDDHFELLEGDRDGVPIIVVRDAGLKAIDHLAYDHAIAIDIPYDARDNGLPIELDALDAFEDAVLEATDDLVFHGRETSGGSRTLFAFGAAGSAKAIRAWLKTAKRRGVTVESAPDPQWDGLARWE